MNAFNNVNLAAACILTSVGFARELGVPEEKWIYPLGGACASDSDECKNQLDVHVNLILTRVSLATSKLHLQPIDLALTRYGTASVRNQQR